MERYSILADDRTWRTGPPPHVGWWNASTEKHRAYWRWWNGTNWSFPAQAHMNPQHAGICAMRPSGDLHANAMFWNDYWPYDGRVPRVDPETLMTTGTTRIGHVA